MVYFKDIKYNKHIFLYHGDIYKHMKTVTYTNKNFIGLSLKFNNSNHILHDITKAYDLLDNNLILADLASVDALNKQLAN